MTSNVRGGADAGGSSAGAAAFGAVPKTMVEALETDDPRAALLALSDASDSKALDLSKKLTENMKGFSVTLPEILSTLPNPNDAESHPVATAMACSDSILQSLTKIATGGSQASQEIRNLEDEKRSVEAHAQDVETAIVLRDSADAAAQSLSAGNYEAAARAVAEYSNQQDENRLTERALAYAGDYTVTQLESTRKALRATLLDKYQKAVDDGDLMMIGKLTQLVQMIKMEKEAVDLYLTFLNHLLTQDMKTALEKSDIGQDNTTQAKTKAKAKQKSAKTLPFVPMAQVYNCAVSKIRHHLPMVSHYLYRADGDTGVVQLIHGHVESSVGPLFDSFVTDRQLGTMARDAQRIYAALEDKYGNQGDFGADEHDGDEIDDCGFTEQIGKMTDVDAMLEESALCLQHAESYTRFMLHTVSEVHKARALRHRQAQEAQRIERERKEWAAGMSSSASASAGNQKDETGKESKEKEYVPQDILPAHSQLFEQVAEIGGYYAVIERCLLLASMQRAFLAPVDDLRNYSPLGIRSNSPAVASRALQTSIVETCLYAARRSTQRAFATGHTGTASAVANFSADCLRNVLAEVLRRRAEELGVSMLKPGEGLIAGSSGIFNASNLIRQGQTVSHAVGGGKVDEEMRRREIEQGIACACATLNDLDVATGHTGELEKILSQTVEKGYPSKASETEQLRQCVKSLSPVAEVFKLSSNATIDSLVSVLQPRVRAIVNDAVGMDGSTTAAFSVMGGNKAADRTTVRMNYNLDEEAYQLLELSEGYISRLCTGLGEVLRPLRLHLAPRLSDMLVLGVLGTASKRLEASLKKCQFTYLGALSLDSDMRDLLHYAKDLLDANDLDSNMAIYRACMPLARLMQISKLLSVDDLDDVLDLIRSSKRKGNWDLKLDDAKAFLNLRVEFENDKVNELLTYPDDD